ncbi:putative hydrolase of the HAD superfamily [Natronobacillus azotifigens]|uniref:HAD hydrolase-like protein n=1 Tax=Natronobacillus azotifigens TaxID=472978 RepID=A0A9J6RDZ9_9BACI|nr:HAD hydrolase-like protein [Natronobacillus azotifigens]
MKKLYIFDLDGTLYEGSQHFDYYAKLLSADVTSAEQEDYWNDYEKMKAGNHVVQIGKAYDVNHDLSLTIDPMTLKVVEAHRWDGSTVDDLDSLYGDGQVSFDFENIVAIGDGWWLPFACAKHYGVKESQPSYMATKEFMVSDQFQLEQIPGLRTFLLDLKKEHDIILMTNSDREDVNRLLGELDLTNVFDHVISSARKPSKTTVLFEQLHVTYDLPFEQMISVGDNFINEIAPALLLEMKAVYLSEHPHKTEHKNLQQYGRITDWIEEMK